MAPPSLAYCLAILLPPLFANPVKSLATIPQLSGRVI